LNFALFYYYLVPENWRVSRRQSSKFTIDLSQILSTGPFRCLLPSIGGELSSIDFVINVLNFQVKLLKEFLA